MITWALSGVSWSHFGCSRDNMASCLHLPTYFRSRFKKLKYYPFYPWILVKWVGNDGILKKLIDFCHFEFMESKNYQYMSSETSILSLFWCMFLRFLATNFRNKKNPYRVHQVNFLLQNINDGDKMKAWKPLTHHGLLLSYGGKVHFCYLYLIA